MQQPLLLAVLLASLGTPLATAQSLVRDINATLVDGSTDFESELFSTAGFVLCSVEGFGELSEKIFAFDGTPGGVELLFDFPGIESSRQTEAIELPNGEALIATGYSNFLGRELYKTDGTAGGSALVADIRPGESDGVEEILGAFGSQVLVRANDGTTGRELWETDGTAAGTALVADINPGPGNSNPSAGVAFQGKYFFAADDGVHGRDVWCTDGTAAGTSLLIDLPSPLFGLNAEFAVVGSTLLFAVTNDAGVRLLYKSDGTAAGTGPLEPVPSAYSPSELTVVGNECFFKAWGSNVGFELWRTDGSTVSLVQDIAPGISSSAPERLRALNGFVTFLADDGTHGVELWRSHGTTSASMIADLTPGSADTDFYFYESSMHSMGTQLAFVADLGLGDELYVTDGTASGTGLVKDIDPAVGASSGPRGMTTFQGQLVFHADDGTSGRELWTSDLTPAGTVLYEEITPPSPAPCGTTEMIRTGDVVLFDADDGVHGSELWVTNGTPTGTQMLIDINTTAPGASSSPHDFVEYQGLVYFAATDADGEELWVTDGTAGGTMQIGDLNPGASGSGPRYFVEFQGLLYFAAATAATGLELWRTDGTAAGTTMLPEILPGTSGGIATLARQPLAATPSALIILTSVNAVYFHDGVTTAILDGPTPIRPNLAGSTLSHDGYVYFFGSRNGLFDLWRTDGTAAGTAHIKKFNPVGSIIQGGSWGMTPLGDCVLVSADGGSLIGQELWITDGTTAGTTVVRDIAPGSADSDPFFLYGADDVVLFSAARAGVTGRELWRTDGTTAGTVLVGDFLPGLGSSLSAVTAHAVGDGVRAVLPIDDGVHGRELFVTDTTNAGTQPLFDLAPGAADGLPPVDFPSLPVTLAFLDDRAVFIGATPATGTALFCVLLSELEPSILEEYGVGCPGTGGAVPSCGGVGFPAIGLTFDVALQHALPNATAACFVGFGPVLDLPIGGGCSLLTNPVVSIPITTSAVGTFSLPIPLSTDPGQIGNAASFQWAIIDSAGAFGPGLASFSNALRMVIGRS